jgi:hypothetical protein
MEPLACRLCDVKCSTRTHTCTHTHTRKPLFWATNRNTNLFCRNSQCSLIVSGAHLACSKMNRCIWVYLQKRHNFLWHIQVYFLPSALRIKFPWVSKLIWIFLNWELQLHINTLIFIRNMLTCSLFSAWTGESLRKPLIVSCYNWL